MTAAAAHVAFRGSRLALELIDPQSMDLVRLTQHTATGGDWDPPAQMYRNLRVDPPPGHKSTFSVLYTANTLACVAMECRVLQVDASDRYTWNRKAAERYDVVRFGFSKPAIFIPIDGLNRDELGLGGTLQPLGSYEPYQNVALQLHTRYGGIVHGMSWQSFHRGQPGRAYAIWHEHRDTIGLSRNVPGQNYPKLADDSEWQAYLANNPHIVELTP